MQVCIIKHSFKGLFRYSILSNICSTCLVVVPIVTAMGLDRATSSTHPFGVTFVLNWCLIGGDRMVYFRSLDSDESVLYSTCFHFTHLL